MNISSVPGTTTMPVVAGVDAPRVAGQPTAVADTPVAAPTLTPPSEPPRLNVMSALPLGAAAALAELPTLDGSVGVQIQVQISEHMLTLTELVQTVKKAMGEMRELVAQDVMDAAQAQK